MKFKMNNKKASSFILLGFVISIILNLSYVHAQGEDITHEEIKEQLIKNTKFTMQVLYGNKRIIKYWKSTLIL